MKWPEALLGAIIMVFCTPLGWIGLLCLAVVISSIKG